MKIGRVVPNICVRTDRQTDRHAHRNAPLPYEKNKTNAKRSNCFTFILILCYLDVRTVFECRQACTVFRAVATPDESV